MNPQQNNIFRFYKTESNRWYVYLPSWEGSVADLEMVAGADNMLEYMSEGKNDIKLIISEEFFEGSDLLEFKREADEWGNGAFYIFRTYKSIEINLDMWLCDVTKFIFGKFPKKLYICAL